MDKIIYNFDIKTYFAKCGDTESTYFCSSFKSIKMSCGFYPTWVHRLDRDFILSNDVIKRSTEKRHRFVKLTTDALVRLKAKPENIVICLLCKTIFSCGCKQNKY